jgi:hypothetical protein
MSAKLLAEGIVADSANHAHRVTQPRNRNCLIGALAAGMDLKSAADDSFSPHGDTFGVCH